MSDNFDIDGESAFNSIQYFNDVYMLVGKEKFALYIDDFFYNTSTEDLFNEPEPFKTKDEINNLVTVCQSSKQNLKHIVSGTYDIKLRIPYVENMRSFCDNAHQLVTRTLQTCSDRENLELILLANEASQRVLTDCQELISFVEDTSKQFQSDVYVSGFFPDFDDVDADDVDATPAIVDTNTAAPAADTAAVDTNTAAPAADTAAVDANTAAPAADTAAVDANTSTPDIGDDIDSTDWDISDVCDVGLSPPATDTVRKRTFLDMSEEAFVTNFRDVIWKFRQQSYTYQAAMEEGALLARKQDEVRKINKLIGLLSKIPQVQGAKKVNSNFPHPEFAGVKMGCGECVNVLFALLWEVIRAYLDEISTDLPNLFEYNLTNNNYSISFTYINTSEEYYFLLFPAPLAKMLYATVLGLLEPAANDKQRKTPKASVLFTVILYYIAGCYKDQEYASFMISSNGYTQFMVLGLIWGISKVRKFQPPNRLTEQIGAHDHHHKLIMRVNKLDVFHSKYNYHVIVAALNVNWFNNPRYLEAINDGSDFGSSPYFKLLTKRSPHKQYEGEDGSNFKFSTKQGSGNIKYNTQNLDKFCADKLPKRPVRPNKILIEMRPDHHSWKKPATKSAIARTVADLLDETASRARKHIISSQSHSEEDDNF